MNTVSTTEKSFKNLTNQRSLHNFASWWNDQLR